MSTLILGVVSVWLMARPDPIRGAPHQQPTAAPGARAKNPTRAAARTPGASEHPAQTKQLTPPSAAETEPPATSRAPADATELETRVQVDRSGQARSLADQFFRTYSASAQTSRLERLTGAEPRPPASRDL